MPLNHAVPIPDTEQRRAVGRARREAVSRSSHARCADRPDSFDVTGLLASQDVTRITELVPLRYERMLESPFAFFRGSALIMAHDLARGASSEIETQICGDAHLANFGVFSSPERRLVFDVNDFDETTTGPFEWDVKRLATSLCIAAEGRDFSVAQRGRIVRAAVREYRETIRTFSESPALSVWYAHLDIASLTHQLGQSFSDESMKQVHDVVRRAVGKTSQRAYDKLVVEVNGVPRIAYDPPTLVPLDQLVGRDPLPLQEMLQRVVGGYAESLSSDRHVLFRKFTPYDAARKVVGVGSVGTGCYIVLLYGRDRSDPFFLQIKEATDSVVDRARGRVSPRDPGDRVVAGQRLMQATPDVFLGHYHETGRDGTNRSYYVRQLFDNKGSVVIHRMDAEALEAYGKVCAWTLARAHARSGGSVEIAGYLGKSETFDTAIEEFAEAYRVQNALDFATVTATRDSSRVG